MRKVKGLTLVELLVVMVLSLIIGAGFVALYRNLIGNVAERSTIIKNKEQLNFVMDNLAKLLSTAGFGIDINQINNAINIDNSAQGIRLLTRVANQATNAGCWGIIDQNGNFIRQASSNDTIPVSFNTYRECPENSVAYNVRISIENKTLNCQRNCLAFIGNPAELRLYLNNQNLHPSCLQGTQRLMLDISGTPQEILQCVAHLSFRYLVYDNDGNLQATDARPLDVKNVAGVRVCMMVQLSESAPGTGTNTEIEYSPQCGGQRLTQLNSALQDTWRYRKWEKIEMDIFMPSLQY